MNFVGIIAEYDPFHSGHALQLRMLRQRGASTIAVCMSTGVVQRGGVPILPEAVRVRAALAAGADLVVALPAPYANASAEQFAAAGVHLLAALGCDTLAFGAENPEPAPLQAAAAALCSAAFPAALRSQLESGLPFAAARAAAAETLCPGAADLLQTPNNILGIEYCKALLRLNSQIRPVTIRREGMGYHETTVPEGDSASSSPDLQSSTDFFASATAIRSLIQNPGDGHSEASSDINNPVRNPDTKTANILSSQIPPDAFYVFKKALDSGEFLTENSLDSILSYCLMKENVESLSSYMDVSEDLARRIINQQNLLLSFSQSVSVLKTRELTQTRIQRALLHIILNIHTAPTQIPFARVLGFRKESSELLSRIKQHSRIPLITKLADAQNLLDSEGNQILSETVFSSNLYEKLLCLKTGRKFCHESQKQLIIL